MTQGVKPELDGLVIEELAGLAADRLVWPDTSFWRTQAGAEADQTSAP